MKAFLAIFSFLLITSHAFCGWTPVNTGISDDFTSISFSGTTGLITGKKGVYISTNGGTTAGSWLRAQNYLTPADSVSYNRSQFYGSVPGFFSATGRIFFCGSDTVSNVSVIFEYNTSNGKLKRLYSGTNIRFNDMSQRSSLIYAVGDNGQMVVFDESNPVISNVQTGLNYNLQSVAFFGTAAIITSDDLMIKGTMNASMPAVGTFSSSNYPNRHFKDAIFSNSMSNICGVGINLFRDNNSSITEPHQYYADSLNGNTVLFSSNRVFVGAKNGIYRSPTGSNILEFQPSSAGNHILSIQTNGTNVFACGKNGAILYSSDLGGDPEPYAQIVYTGGCVNTPQSVSSTKGTVTTCSNYVNNTYINSNCSGFTYTFTAQGTHQIKLVVSNASYSKTITKDITIVPIPQTNLLTDVLDSILCKQEPLNLTLSNTENDVYYSLHKTGTNTFYGNSPNGNGSDLSFQTNTLSQAGTYYIRANSSIVSCSKNFTDLITIQVEKPVSKFYFDIVNAEVNEDVRFYEKAINATNFEWLFTNTPALSTSNSADPINSFSGIGSSQVTLIAGTNNNCYDTTTIRGPFIYQPYTTDSSWLLLNSRIAPSSNNTTAGEDIIKTIRSSRGGYVVIGNYLHRQVNSRVGDSVRLPGMGQYVAKYDTYGILKWCIKTPSIAQSGFSYNLMTDITEDSQGNLFVTGNSPSGIIDNKGDTLLSNSSFLLKTDSLGRTIWSRSMLLNNGSFLNVNHDYNDDIYLSVGFLHNIGYPGPNHPFLLNGTPADTLSYTGPTCSACNDVHNIVKITNDGVKVYDFMIEISTANRYVTPKVAFDSLNNMYLWGSKEIYGVIHEPASGDTIQLFFSPNNYGGKMYISKFDVNGNYIWKMQGYTQDALNDRTEIFELIADESGNLYATGQNDYDGYASSDPHVIVNSDNSHSTLYGGKYFLAKINSDGITQWMRGNNFSYYGMGLDVLMDGDTLYTVGMARTNNFTTLQHEFTGGGNYSIPLTSGVFNYFVAKYTTSGEILAVYLNSPANLQTGQYLDINNYPNLIKLDDGYFLLNKSVSVYNAPDPAKDFGFTLPYTGFPQDGTQLKIKLNQGVEFLPQYHASVYDTICYGSSYTLPNGMELEDLTSATVYVDSLIAANGTDSITRYYISVNAATIYDQTVEVCFGGHYEIQNDTIFSNIESNFTYDQLIVSPSSCDSIIRYHILVNSPAIHHDTAAVCFGKNYSIPNDTVFANVQSDFVYDQLIDSPVSCDSIIRHHVLVIPLAIHPDTAVVCLGESYHIPNDTTFTGIQNNFVYDQLIVSPTSCDSIIRHHVVVNPTYTTFTSMTVCEGDDIVLSNGMIAATNMQHDSIIAIAFQSVHGCDSILNISVHVIEVNELVIQNEYQLSGQDPLATYQWVNCSTNFSIVPGQTGITFTPVVNGVYAVIVTKDGCIDTSICFLITGLSLSELGYDISVYPNPTNSKSVIDFGQTLGSASIGVYSSDGRKILETPVEGITKYELDLGPFEKGTYFVRIITAENKQSAFILVKN